MHALLMNQSHLEKTSLLNNWSQGQYGQKCRVNASVQESVPWLSGYPTFAPQMLSKHLSCICSLSHEHFLLALMDLCWSLQCSIVDRLCHIIRNQSLQILMMISSILNLSVTSNCVQHSSQCHVAMSNFQIVIMTDHWAFSNINNKKKASYVRISWRNTYFGNI